MFESIHALRKRSDKFVKDINKHKIAAIKTSEKVLVKLNQEQFQASKLATGKKFTPLYSDPYAKRKGYSKPDLFVTGNMYDKMEVETKSDGSYEIDSTASYTKYLLWYGKIFGIMPANIPKASKALVLAMQKLWFSLVVK